MTRAVLVSALTVAVLAVVALRQPPVAPAGSHATPTRGMSCTACHATDAPRVHAEEWVTRGHAEPARRDAASCIVCHARASCDACHARPASAPVSHTALFRSVRGAGRAQHVEAARAKPESCAICHAPRQASTCGRCHAPLTEVRR